MLFDQLDDGQKADLWACLAIRQLSGLGATRSKKLADFFGSPYKAVCEVRKWTMAGLGVRDVSVEEFERNGWREAARAEWECIQAWSRSCPPDMSAGILLYGDEAYPESLREIPDAPLFIFYLGDLTLLKNPSVAVVGARKCTTEGLAVAVNIVRGLTQAGVTAISGLAKGIDRVVHLAGLEGVGSSIAVLGSGIDVPYPAPNIDLYNRMIRDGLVLSEFMPGTAPAPRHFPVRNRIISGLAKAVLVVEAALRSGTLITARHAVEQNRDVFAVPGSTLSSTSAGCRELIRRGARPVFSAADILLELSPILEPELAAKFLEKRRAGPFSAEEAHPDNGATPKEAGIAAGERGEERESLPRTSGGPQNAGHVTEHNDQRQLLSKLCGHGILPWTNEDKNGSDDPNRGKAPVAENVKNRPDLSGLGPDETAVVTLLFEQGGLHLDDIALRLEIPVSRLSGLLAVLEVRGIVKRLPGMHYAAV